MSGFFSFLNPILTMFKPAPGLVRILSGSRYPWTASVEGDDIVVRGVHATWFGGSNDPEDDGTTASGISTKANPAFNGCALPVDLGRPHNNPCHGSPLPHIPFFTKVQVTNTENGEVGECTFIDLGPSAPPVATAAIDLMQSFFVALGGDLERGTMQVEYRILGAAKYAGGAA